MQELSSRDDVDAWLARPGARWLFKHSSACGISFAAKEQVDAHLAQAPDQELAMVVIQDHRPVSNYIAEATGRVHASPQLFLLVDGTVAWAATHYSITSDAMQQAWTEHAAAG